MWSDVISLDLPVFLPWLNVSLLFNYFSNSFLSSICCLFLELRLWCASLWYSCSCRSYRRLFSTRTELELLASAATPMSATDIASRRDWLYSEHSTSQPIKAPSTARVLISWWRCSLFSLYAAKN